MTDSRNMILAIVLSALVLFGWVARDASPERGWVMAVHLTNTLLLLGAKANDAAYTAEDLTFLSALGRVEEIE